MMLGLLPLTFGFSLQPVPVSVPPLRLQLAARPALGGLRMVDTPQPQPETVDRFLAKYAWNPLRRNVYALLKPVCTRRSRAPFRLGALPQQCFCLMAQVDKGEFRWEFLVPWVNRSLTTTEKVVVCSAFVVASFTLQKLFDPGASAGPHPNPPPPHPTPPHPTCRLRWQLCRVHVQCAQCVEDHQAHSVHSAGSSLSHRRPPPTPRLTLRLPPAYLPPPAWAGGRARL